MTGKPIPLNRTGCNWEEFNLKLKAFVGLRSEPLVREMERMEEPNAADPNIEADSVDISAENRNLYYDLTMLTTGTSLKLVKGVSGNNGLEAYRQQCRRWHAGTRGRNLARLQAILQWNFGTTATETLDSLASWESEIEEWEQLTGERMADSIKLCVLDAQAPKELSTYLRLHTKAEETFATVKRKIQDYLQAIDQSGPVPMEVGFVGKKGKKGKGKQQQSKGGGKQNKGKDKQSQDKNQTKAHEGKGQGKPEQGKQSSGKFQGYCGNCGKWGHPQRECWGKSINNLADSTSASSSSRVDTYNSSSDHGTGAGQGGFAGSIWEHDEVDDTQWIFSMGGAGWPSGFQGRPGQWCTILIDSGSSATVCGPQHFPESPIVPSERLSLYEPSGKPLMHYGQKEVKFVAEDGQNVQIKFDVANVVRPIVSVGKLQQGGKEVVLGWKSYIQERRGRRGVRRLGLFNVAALFFLRLQIAAGCDTGASRGRTKLGTQATDEVWAVEGPEVPGMPIEEPEHQGGVFNSENEETEGPEARGLPTPMEPTKAEVEWHNLTHVPHAPWCSVCVRGRGRDSRHEAQGAEARADSESWPYIQVDYFFMKYRDEEVAQPYLSAIDSKYGRCMAVKCVTKGSQDEYAVKALENFCRQLGAEKFFLQSDPEPSIQDVVGKVCAKVPGGMARTTPKQSKQSLGLAERFHGTVESDCRVLLLSILTSFKLELFPPMHPIFDRLVRHAAWVHERFRRSRHDGRTAIARHMLREYPSQVVPFGETVIFRDTGPIKCKLRSN